MGARGEQTLLNAPLGLSPSQDMFGGEGWEACVLYWEGQAVLLSMHSVTNDDAWSVLSGPAEGVG